MDEQRTPAQRAEMLALLAKYGRHVEDCPLGWRDVYFPLSTPEYSCGLDDARAELARTEHAT